MRRYQEGPGCWKAGARGLCQGHERKQPQHVPGGCCWVFFLVGRCSFCCQQLAILHGPPRRVAKLQRTVDVQDRPEGQGGRQAWGMALHGLFAHRRPRLQQKRGSAPALSRAIERRVSDYVCAMVAVPVPFDHRY